VQNQFYRSFLLLFTLLFVFILPARAAFTSMVVIGDSLSDQGNVFDFTSALPPSFLTPPLEYTDGTNFGRFTNGLNYIDYLSSSLNLSVTPSRLGGSNYAYGGALTNTDQLGIPSRALSSVLIFQI
jgi:phospholipase/lecithinase/hemolysin